MTIYNNAGEVLLTVDVSDNSYRYTELKGDDYVQVEFYSKELIDIPVGAYIEISTDLSKRARYTLYKSPQITQENTKGYIYNLRMEGDRAIMKQYVFYNTVDKRTSFTLSATPIEHLKMILDNLNMREGANMWRCDESKCITGDVTTISYEGLSCYDALQLLAATCDTEYDMERIENPDSFNVSTGVVKPGEKYIKVTLNRIEYEGSSPVTLAYGKGNGLISGITRSADEDISSIGVVFIKGGNKNINPSKYGSPTLLLPQSNTSGIMKGGKFDGNYFSNENGYNQLEGRAYTISERRNSVSFDDTTNKAETVIDCSDIFPQRIGSVTNYTTTNGGKPTVFDNKIPSDLNYNDYLIDGQQLTIVFQSGMLAGKEFKATYDHSNKYFVIEPIYIDDYLMPSNDFKPARDDKYIVYGVAVPDSYVQSAEIEVLRKALKELIIKSSPIYTYTMRTDIVHVKANYIYANGAYQCGSRINLTGFGETKALRVLTRKNNINTPYSIELTLGNGTTKRRWYVSQLLTTSQQAGDNRTNHNFMVNVNNSLDRI